MSKTIYTTGERKRRSFAKAFTWRVLASLDTTIIAYFILDGDLKKAISIGGFEVITKLGIYFFHERAWNKVRWGKRIGDITTIRTEDTKRRSVAKATSWRVLGTIDTFVLSKIISKSTKHAASIAVIELFTKPILYFLHERVWNNIKWGKREFEQLPNET